MSGSPRPEYFVARADGTLTPMIAMDELPSSVRIAGVPTTITPAGTQNMISLGLKERSNQRYVVLSTNDTGITGAAEKVAEGIEEEPVKAEGPQKASMKVLESFVAEPSKMDKDNGEAPKRSAEHEKQGAETGGHAAQKVKSWRERVQNDAQVNGNRPTNPGSEDVKETNDDAASGKGSKSSHESPADDNLPSKAAYGGMGTRGTLGKKVYCTHWIRWGECDYTQQGCLYKHEMPDEDKLQEIGIATFPRWYRIANPEKFNGVTDGPVWHRRPGPAPTDQLWRGPPPARPVEPQTYEDFRSNARPAPAPAPAPAPVHRQPFGPPANHGSGPVLFAFDPNGNTFHSFGNFGNYQSGYGQPPRQNFSRAPVPRVVTVQPPFVRQQRPDYTGPSANSGGQAASTSFSTGPAQGNSTASSQPETRVTEITEPTPADSQSKQSAQQSAATHFQPTAGKFGSSPPKTAFNRPMVNGNGAVDQAQDVVPQSSPTKNLHNSPSNPATVNGNQSGNTYSSQTARHEYTHGRQGLNETYQPLVPSPMPRQSAPPNGNISGSTIKNHFVPPPPTPPTVHRRFFVPAGQAQHAANTNGCPRETAMNEGSGPNGGSRKNANNLVDV